jgi:tripartite-type tricarboxylate transporter receptor subunit TctC
MTTAFRLRTLSAALMAAVLATTTAQAADDVADFYRGKQIRIVIGSAAGDGIDALIRTVARHLSDHLPGNPTILPQNMPGAGSRVAANWLYNVAPRDGSVIGNITANTPLDQALKEDGIQFDVAKFNWIGNALVINSIIMTWAPSGYVTVDDVVKKGGYLCGGSGGTSPSLVNPQILKNLTGADIRIISGYGGNAAIGLAMERGEVHCLGSTNMSSSRVMFSAQLHDKRMIPLVQQGVEKDPTISEFAGHEVPLISDFAKTEADRKVMTLITSGVAFGRPILTPPEVPAARVAALRKAFDETMKDPAFLTDAEKQTLDVNPISGNKLQKLAAEVSLADDSLVDRIKEMTTLRGVVEKDKK